MVASCSRAVDNRLRHSVVKPGQRRGRVSPRRRAHAGFLDPAPAHDRTVREPCGHRLALRARLSAAPPASLSQRRARGHASVRPSRRGCQTGPGLASACAPDPPLRAPRHGRRECNCCYCAIQAQQELTEKCRRRVSVLIGEARNVYIIPPSVRMQPMTGMQERVAGAGLAPGAFRGGARSLPRVSGSSGWFCSSANKSGILRAVGLC